MIARLEQTVEANLFGDGTDVVVETWGDPDLPNGRRHIVRRRKPLPYLTMEVIRGRFAADGNDAAEVLVRVLDPWETEQQGAQVYLRPAGTVKFEVNMATEPEDLIDGEARFRLSTTVAGRYEIRARLEGYGEDVATVEAVVV